jgi:SPP1 family phage portal protein
LNKDKPLRATYYEEDGFTEYIWEDGQGAILKDKQSYIQVVRQNYDGVEILDGKNYPSFPIVPLWANPERTPELMGLKEEIDAFDLIKSGFANDLDDVSQIYWIIQNAGGMDDTDLARFIERIKVNKAVNLDSDQSEEAHTIEVPYNARETYLTRLESDMYKDAMIVNMDAIAQGNTVATAIRASYEPQDDKADEFEDCIKDFIEGILELIGIEDEPSFTRSRIVNQAEETQMILASAQYLDDETVVRKLPFITADEIDDILEKRGLEEYGRFGEGEDGQAIEENGEGTPKDL